MTFTISKTRLAIGIVAVAMLVPASAMAFHVFDDVADDRFYAEPVEWAFDNDITTGKTATTFAPDDGVTRGESVTFLKRYNDNVVQPAIDELETAKIGHGEIVLSHGTLGLDPRGAGPGTYETLDTITRVSGDGSVNASLTGPVSLDGTDYELTNVQYCIDAVGGGAVVTGVQVFGSLGASNAATIENDGTDRTADGCYDVPVDNAGITYVAYSFQWDFDGGGTLGLNGMQSTWSPVDPDLDLIALGSDDGDDANAPD